MKQNNFFILLLIAGFTSIITAQVPSYVPTNGLVGYWPFNGNANDLSGSNLNGTVNGSSLTTDRFNNSNSAYNYNGINNKISLPFQQTGITSYSISAWFKTSLGGPLISGRGSSNQIGITLHIHNISTGGGNNGKIIYVVDGPSSSIGKITNNTFIDNNWHHIVGVFNGAAGAASSNQFFIYIDNVLVSQSNTNTGSGFIPINNGTNLLIGSHQTWPSGNFFNGILDDIGIWNRALTTDEISNLYNANICYQSVTVTDTLVINVGTLSYNPVTYNNSITIYPNPANDHITIDCGTLSAVTGYQIKISNLLGQEVFSTTLNQQQYSIPLNSWTGKGIYLVTVYDANSNLLTTRKIDLQ